jgi:hypothetical protein
MHLSAINAKAAASQIGDQKLGRQANEETTSQASVKSRGVAVYGWLCEGMW